jgi:hypothetical protein
MAHQPQLDHHVRLFAGIAIGSVVLSGCGGSGDSQPDERRPPDDGPVIALTEKVKYWPAGIVTGRLTHRDGCLLIGGAVAVFPLGADWDPPLVTFHEGQHVEVDTWVRMGGGGSVIKGLTQDALPATPVSDLHECADRTGVRRYVLAAPSRG